MIRVYHSPDNLFGQAVFLRHQAQIEFVREHFAQYVDVCDVKTNDLDIAYNVTQSVDNHWSVGNRLIARDSGLSLRSTSVGDVLIDLDTKKAFVVASFGFQEVTLT